MEKLRECIVNGELAYFHRWADKSQLVLSTPARGPQTSSILHNVIGIIEREDGTVHECYPGEIKFKCQEIREAGYYEKKIR